MPRPTRILLPSIPVHLVQRGNNRGTCFHFRSDAERFLDLLDESRREYRVDVHAYVLMTNHFHLLATPRDDPQAVRLMMKSLGQRYAQYLNPPTIHSENRIADSYPSHALCCQSEESDTGVLGA